MLLDDFSQLEDDRDAEFLLQGFNAGFMITDDTGFRKSWQPNYTSAMQHLELVDEQINQDLTAGRYVLTSSKPTRVSPLAAISKSSSSIRLIHVASSPEANSINSHYKQKDPIRFQSIQDFYRLLRPGCFVAKVEIKHAYRAVGMSSCKAWVFLATGRKAAYHRSRSPTWASRSTRLLALPSACRQDGDNCQADKQS